MLIDAVRETLSLTSQPSATFTVPCRSDIWLTYPGLSQAFTSPGRLIDSTSGYISTISFGNGPFGPFSTLVVMMVGRL